MGVFSTYLTIFLALSSSCKLVRASSETPQDEFVEDKELLYLRRQQQTRCSSESACIIKFFDAAVEPFYFVSECRAGKVQSISFVETRYVETFPGELFRDLKNLKSVTWNNSALSKLPPGSFEHAKKLEEISLTNNSIQVLEAHAFSEATQLSTIDLSHNKIREVHVGAFGKLKSLRTLVLSGNLLETLDHQTFADNDRLHSVDLSKNRLASLDPRIFHQNEKIEWVFLNENLLTSLHLRLHYNSLYWFNADDNRIQNLTLEAEGALERSVTYITANRNNLTSLRVSPKFRVRNLYVENNNLIDLFDIQSMTHLADLRLGNNKLAHVSTVVFKNLRNLEILYMHNTGLPALRSELFAHQKKLKVLHVGYNQLGFVDLRFLAGLKALEELYIDGNELTDLTVGDLREWLPALKKMELRANPWVCANLKTVMGYLKAYEIELVSVEVEGDAETNVSGIKCYVQGKHVETLSCKLRELERRFSQLEESYKESLNFMRKNDCCDFEKSNFKMFQGSVETCGAP